MRNCDMFCCNKEMFSQKEFLLKICCLIEDLNKYFILVFDLSTLLLVSHGGKLIIITKRIACILVAT